MAIDRVVEDLLRADGRSLVFVLGEEARQRVEAGFVSAGSQVATLERSRRDVKVVFLNKLQYLLMFLMKLEAERVAEYSSVVLYGLDTLVEAPGNSATEQVRLTNLVVSTLYKVRQKHDLRVAQIVWMDESSAAVKLDRIVAYWDALLR